MNPYIRRLNSFSPVTIAQAPIPGQAVGNMDGIPLEALQGTSSPKELKQEGIYGGNIPPGGGGMIPPGFDAPLTGAPQRKYVTDIPIRAEYRNIYGANFGGTYNPTTGDIKGSATIPIGPAHRGYKVGGEIMYNPGQMDAYGMTPPPSFGGMIRFSKTNPVDPSIYKKPGAEKYAIELGIDGRPRAVPPERQIPVQIQPGPGDPFQQMLLQQRGYNP